MTKNPWEGDPILNVGNPWDNDPLESSAQPVARSSRKSGPGQDALLNIGASTNHALTSIADVFGAGNSVSQFFRGNADTLEAQLSQDARERQSAEAAELAASPSFGSKFLLAAKQAASSPLQSGAKALGFLLPTIATGGAGAAAGLSARGLTALNVGMGGAMGAGAVKGGIYETVRDAADADLMQDPRYATLRRTLSEPDAKQTLGIELQSYEKNGGKIALGAGVGALTGATGAEAAVASSLARSRARAALQREASLLGVGKVAATEALTEVPQEMLETTLGNTGAASGGGNISPMQGVAEAGGSALVVAPMSGGLGGVMQASNARRQLASVGDAAPLDGNTIVDPENATLGLPAPLVRVDSQGNAVRDGQPVPVMGKRQAGADSRRTAVRETIQQELAALGYDPTPRATQTPITVNATGQAMTDDQVTPKDLTMEPPARVIGRSNAGDIRTTVRDELAAMGLVSDDPRSTSIEIQPTPSKVTAPRQDTGYSVSAVTQPYTASADAPAFAGKSPGQTAFYADERVRTLADASNARKRGRGVPIQAEERSASRAGLEPTSQLGVVRQRLSDGTVRYFLWNKPDEALILAVREKTPDRSIVSMADLTKPIVLKAALADGGIEAGSGAIASEFLQRLPDIATDEFGVTRLTTRAEIREKLKAETNRIAAKTATAAADKIFSGTQHMEMAMQAIAADPQKAGKVLRQKNETQALADLQRIAQDGQSAEEQNESKAPLNSKDSEIKISNERGADTENALQTRRSTSPRQNDSADQRPSSESSNPPGESSLDSGETALPVLRTSNPHATSGSLEGRNVARTEPVLEKPEDLKNELAHLDKRLADDKGRDDDKGRAFVRALSSDAKRDVSLRVHTPEPGSAGAHLADQVKQRLGVDLVYFTSDDKAAPLGGAQVKGDPKTLYVNGVTAEPEFVVGHEFLHSLHQAYPDLYGKLVGLLRDYSKSTLANADAIRKDYSEGGVNAIKDSLIEEENLADVAGRAFADSRFWTDFDAAMDGEPVGTVKQFFRWISRWFTKHFNKIDLNSEIDRAAKVMRTHVADAYAEAVKRNSSTRSIAADIELGAYRSHGSDASKRGNYSKLAEPRAEFDGDIDVTEKSSDDFSHLFGEPVELRYADIELSHGKALQADEKDAVSAALGDLVRAGMPKTWLSGLTRIFAYKGNNLGKAAYIAQIGNGKEHEQTFIIALANNANRLIPAIGRSTLRDQQELRGAIAHEIAHHIDRQPGNIYGFSAESPRMKIGLGKKENLKPVGDIARELVNVYLGESQLAEYLEIYPLGAFLDGDMPSFMVQQELFAQAVRAFFTNGALLKTEAPITYGVIDGIVNGQENSPQANVQAALWSGHPDSGWRNEQRPADPTGRSGDSDEGTAAEAFIHDGSTTKRDDGIGEQPRVPSPGGKREAGVSAITQELNRGSSGVSSATLRSGASGNIDGELSRLGLTGWLGKAVVKTVTPVTATAQAANRVVDRMGSELGRLTGVKKAGEKVVSVTENLLDTKSSWGWVERAKQGLVSDYGLPEEYLTAKIGKQARENKLLRQTQHTLDRLSAMNPDQLAVAYQWLQEKPDTAREQELLAKLPSDQQSVMRQIKDDIDSLSKEAVTLGLITPETYERNKMAYVHRSYKKYEAELTASQAVARQRSQRLKGDQFKGRGMELEARLDRVRGDLPSELKGMKLEMLERRDGSGKLTRREYLVQGQARPEALRDYTSSGVWEVRDATKGGNIKVWRDFTLEERQRMGEIEDARYGFARTMLQGIRDVETARFLDWTGSNYARDNDGGIEVVDIKFNRPQTFTRDEWVKVPETKIKGTAVSRYGELAGKYLPGIMWNDLQGTLELQDTIWDKLLGAWKISKTALSPAVHVNNVMSNFIMADLAEVGVNDIRQALETLIRSKGGDAKAKSLVERYEDSGAESGSFAANEIRTNTLEPLLKQIAESEPDAVQRASLANVIALVAHGQIGEAAAAATKTVPGRAASATIEAMIQAYQSEDSIFRLAKFMNEINAGKTDLEAGKAAREAFLDYNINAPWVRAARRGPLPFISFTYRAVPLLLKAAATKPWKFAKYAALGQGLSMMAYMMLGGAGDEEKEKRLMPDELKGTSLGLPKMVRMPWNSKDNDPMWLDIRRWLPAGDVTDTNQSKASVPLPQWLSIGGPLSLLIDFASNTDYRGGKIVQGTDTAGETIQKVSDMVLKFALPNLPAPGIGALLRAVGAPVDSGTLDPYSWSAMEKAMVGARNATGKEGDIGLAAANAVGVKLQSRRIADELAAIDRKYKAEQREIKSDITQIANKGARGEIDRAEMQRRIRREIDKLVVLGKKTGEKLTPANNLE